MGVMELTRGVLGGCRMKKVRTTNLESTFGALNLESLRVTVPEIWPGQNRGGKKKKIIK